MRVRVWLVGSEKAGCTASPVPMAATPNMLAMMIARFIDAPLLGIAGCRRDESLLEDGKG
jgi:hypothetical protein